MIGGGADRPGRLLALHHTRAEVNRLSRIVYETVIARSEHIRAGNFTVIGVSDLQLLFDLYDTSFFSCLLRSLLREDGVDQVVFRLSNRMTRAAGKTFFHRTRERAHDGAGRPVVYEIAVSTFLLFHTFIDPGRKVMVGGIECRDRLEALQRVFEHELLHLAEFLGWDVSSCAGENFHRLSERIFSHAGVRHDLVTPREVAAVTYDIRVGDTVGFEHEGVRRVGLVNRITKRVTVLVEDPSGREFSDGKRYLTFYVPLSMLRKETAAN
jgi:hypothetical protein